MSVKDLPSNLLMDLSAEEQQDVSGGFGFVGGLGYRPWGYSPGRGFGGYRGWVFGAGEDGVQLGDALAPRALGQAGVNPGLGAGLDGGLAFLAG